MIKSKYNTENCLSGIKTELQQVHRQRFGKVTIEDYRGDNKQIAKRFDNFRGFKYRYIHDLIEGNIANRDLYFQREEPQAEEDTEINVLDAKVSTPSSKFRSASQAKVSRPLTGFPRRIPTSKDLLSKKSSGSKNNLIEEQSSIYSQRPTTAAPVMNRGGESLKQLSTYKPRNLRISSSNTIVSRPFTGAGRKAARLASPHLEPSRMRSKVFKSGHRIDSALTADIGNLIDEELDYFEQNC